MPDWIAADLAALAQVVLIDVVLAGDNAVVVGMAAAGVERSMRRRVIVWGIVGAVALRILFAVLATRLLDLTGLTLAGGVLLLWVCWKMYREIRQTGRDEAAALAGLAAAGAAPKSFGAALSQIVLADVSMSLDNVLAVAGAAREHVGVLVLGLLLSVALMGAAATAVAALLARHRWIAWIGLCVVLYVALGMVFHGSAEVACLGTDDVETCVAAPLSALRAGLGG
ncbi:YjbE family putative metal transport protein [Oharaeibacter diazotrophicus]|uniref:YjbE family integral membrane protein n=1 Tax=Oharaeibacter diazotrophicus TaxID=1920512 RepID=A0A4R6RBH9_9HYPH|nr:YjbE family putative metal transport protein [Oharaeibacter diazotrophicus]TDP83422.1 YjbE family integral membrane protein [Oharaeibacter diazotrophicus]BBE72255.1 integral membrane protein TerC family protein [Pleomorphomonas sp. SM30]GLS79024.1 membrane protein [Oharaeibacter diazotrophicus]